MRDLLPLVVGFVLTSVLGGLLGYVFQQRAWAHQHRVTLAEQERERATQVFDEVSRLMDRRMYRLRQLYWNVPSDGTDPGAAAKARMGDYREVLYEWNDGINRNLALVQQYFGEGMRRQLDAEIGARFRELGRTVERLWKGDTDPSVSTIEAEIDRLNSMIYGINREMIHAIQTGAVGWRTTRKTA